MVAMVLTTYSSRLEADVAVAKLAASGIEAWIQTDSANGFEPQWDWVRGVRVLTTDFDLAEAAEILGVEPPEPLPPLSPEREAVVQIVRNGIFAVAGVGIAIALWRMLG
jgi:hypothetical protein